MWMAVSLITMTIVAITIGTKDSRSQERTGNSISFNPTPENSGYKDMSRYSITDYDESLPSDVGLGKKRKSANGRYDGEGWVFRSPYPDGAGVGREDEKIPPPAIPVSESALIVIGEITESHAHMSNDKLGVYTEFTIQIKEILKNDADKTLASDQLIVADREGGYVRYPNGQKIFYESSDKALPVIWGEYVLFLTNDKLSPNYRILTLYEFKGDSIVRLDDGRNFDQFKDASKKTFIDSISKKVAGTSR